MFIYSVKAQSIKLCLSIFLSVLSVVFVIAFVPFETIGDESIAVSKSSKEINCKNISTAADRINFLKQFGWEVDAEARDVTRVNIPLKFEPLYEEYNNIQKKDGFDLEPYRGKAVRKYTYLVNNYEYEGLVYANLLIYKDQVIGGDISSAIEGGFMHGFIKDNLSQS